MSEGRYRPLLCLAQVVVDSESPRIILIDTLRDGIDTAPLAELLADPETEVVLHAGRQDVAILRRVWESEVRNVFDTQVAAGFAGASAQAGYGNLLGQLLGRRVGKTASYTRWDARPLTVRSARCWPTLPWSRQPSGIRPTPTGWPTSAAFTVRSLSAAARRSCPRSSKA